VNPPDPVGTISDPIWQQQEANAEASDFVVREHEFVGNTARMNPAGEDHVKQIAVRVGDTPYSVIVEISSMTPREDDIYGYPIHNDAELDMKRRDVVVHALEEMGVKDADQRVVISHQLTPGYQFFEAQQAYGRAFSGRSGRGGGGGRGGNGGGF